MMKDTNHKSGIERVPAEGEMFYVACYINPPSSRTFPGLAKQRHGAVKENHFLEAPYVTVDQSAVAGADIEDAPS